MGKKLNLDKLIQAKKSVSVFDSSKGNAISSLHLAQMTDDHDDSNHPKIDDYNEKNNDNIDHPKIVDHTEIPIETINTSEVRNNTEELDTGQRCINIGPPIESSIIPIPSNDSPIPSNNSPIPSSDSPIPSSNSRVSSNSGLRCSTCCMNFGSVAEQREHCKLDWHRYNLKQKSLFKNVLSEEDFETQIQGELSSISGSDTEDEDLEPTSVLFDDLEIDEVENDVEDDYLFNHPYKLFLITEGGQLVSLYRNIIKAAVKGDHNEDKLLNRIQNLSTTQGVWIYLMLSAGHFAGAVFKKEKVMAHKTFHRYTVRAKRGTAQSAHDAKGNEAKSAGAGLRRYNEQTLIQEVQALLESWSEHIQQSDKIFVKYPNHSCTVFFSGKSPLSKDDHRLQKISVLCRRPTFSEVKRIHNLYSNISFYGLASDVILKLRKYLHRKEHKGKAKGSPTKNNTNNGKDSSKANKDNEETEDNFDAVEDGGFLLYLDLIILNILY